MFLFFNAKYGKTSFSINKEGFYKKQALEYWHTQHASSVRAERAGAR